MKECGLPSSDSLVAGVGFFEEGAVPCLDEGAEPLAAVPLLVTVV